MGAASAILSLKNVTKEFGGINAVDNLSFNVKQASVVGLIGPNGAGKTTVFNLVTGFLRPDCGEISFRGRQITATAPHEIAALGITRTFQALRLFAQMTVLQNVMVGCRYSKGESPWAAVLRTEDMIVEDRQSREQAEDLLRLVGLLDLRNRVAMELSQGQRRLLELARALATQAELLLLDEPVAGVFPETRGKIVHLIQRLRNTGKTVVVIEHDVKLAMRLCDHLIVLNYGRKIAEGTPHDIRTHPTVLEAYFGRHGAA